ncbi:MAG TPA: PilZ domain-containing protein [Kofleriaceae bacterium]
MADNRRTAIRHTVSIVCKFAVGKAAAVDYTLVNLSLGGALLAATTKFPMGERCHIAFKVPTQEETIDIGATVRWSDDRSVGVQFDGLRARDVWALNEFFKQLSPS